MGGGEEATAVEKGGRMSATQAENKQTTVQALRLSMGLETCFPVLAWQILRADPLRLQGGN